MNCLLSSCNVFFLRGFVSPHGCALEWMPPRKYTVSVWGFCGVVFFFMRRLLDVIRQIYVVSSHARDASLSLTVTALGNFLCPAPAPHWRNTVADYEPVGSTGHALRLRPLR